MISCNLDLMMSIYHFLCMYELYKYMEKTSNVEFNDAQKDELTSVFSLGV